MEKKNKVNPKIEDSSKVKLTSTATAPATFPPDYNSKNDLRLVMMFIVETENRNPHVKNMICGKAQKSKTTFERQRRLM